MSIQGFSHEHIIQFAASIEQRGVQLYTAAAGKIRQEAARNVLLHLAEQERKHEAAFRRLYLEITENKKAVPKDIDDEAAGYISALVSAEVFPAEDDAFLQGIETLKDVVAVGLKTEKDSILFYQELMSFGWDSESEQTLSRILQEEKKHLVQLKDLEELIEERDVYY